STPPEIDLSLAISVFGLGYVGTVTATCFADMGFRVIGVDVSQSKVNMLTSGRSPIIEARVAEIASSAHAAGRLTATTEAVEAILNSQITFVCVGTPSLRSGQLDLRHLEKVAGEIGAALAQKDSQHAVVIRSTVLPGTTESVVIPAIEQTSGRKAGEGYA